MTKQLTRQEVEGVIERLADKTLSFGCEIFYGGFTNHIAISDKQEISKDVIGDYYRVSPIQTYNRKILGHHIYLHTILDKAEVVLCWEEEERKDKIYEIWCLWYECGLTKSLQEIVSESGWETTSLLSNPPQQVEVLKSPEANALFSFLQEIGL